MTRLKCLAISLLAAVTYAAGPPFRSDHGFIIDTATNANVSFAGVSWPAHLETMVPEGLQYQSIETIVARLKDLGMNVIRLTFATEMVDEIFDNADHADVPIQTAFTNALGQDNGTAVYNKVVANNPSFSTTTTRLQVFDAVAAECQKQGIYVHLDNHVSKAEWCCTPLDGNGWWGDEDFDAANWTRALTFMATHGKSWPNLASIALRNELREPISNITLYQKTYNWDTWYTQMLSGAQAVSAANPDVLIYFSGLSSDTNISVLSQPAAPLPPGQHTFASLIDALPEQARQQVVLELHSYDIFVLFTNCSAHTTDLAAAGFPTTPSAARAYPVVLSEWGFEQSGAAWRQGYPACMEQLLPTLARGAGWMVWVLAGSYYTNQGDQDSDEPWGLLDHEWKGWRSVDHVDGGLIPMVKATLASGGARPGEGAGEGSGSGSDGGGEKNGVGQAGNRAALGVMMLQVLVGSRIWEGHI